VQVVNKLSSNASPNEDEVDYARNTTSGGINNFEVRQLMKYKAELEELKTKEFAYKKTIEKGDSILNKVSNTSLKNKLLNNNWNNIMYNITIS
jgi:hypothetical protein